MAFWLRRHTLPSINNYSSQRSQIIPKHSGFKGRLSAVFIEHTRYNRQLNMWDESPLHFVIHVDTLIYVCFAASLFCQPASGNLFLNRSVWKQRASHDWCPISATSVSKLLLRYIKSEVIPKSAGAIQAVVICGGKQAWMQQGFALM